MAESGLQWYLYTSSFSCECGDLCNEGGCKHWWETFGEKVFVFVISFCIDVFLFVFDISLCQDVFL